MFNCSNKLVILIIEMLEMFKYEFHENEESYSIGKYSSGAKEEMQLICK